MRAEDFPPGKVDVEGLGVFWVLVLCAQVAAAG